MAGLSVTVSYWSPWSHDNIVTSILRAYYEIKPGVWLVKITTIRVLRILLDFVFR
jgi:hypothetical protein